MKLLKAFKFHKCVKIHVCLSSLISPFLSVSLQEGSEAAVTLSAEARLSATLRADNAAQGLPGPASGAGPHPSSSPQSEDAWPHCHPRLIGTL